MSGVVPLARPGRARLLLAGSTALAGFALLTVLVVVTHGSDAFDRTVELDTVPLRRAALTAVARLVTDLGAVPVVLVVAAFVATALWWRTRSAVPPTVLVTGVLVAGGLVYLLKIAVARSRPPVGALLGPASLDYSFPSGHTTDSGVVYVLSAVLLAPVVGHAVRRLVLTLGLLVPLVVGLSRVYLGYHWATDVLAGWLLAAAVVAAAVALAGLLPDLEMTELRPRSAGGGRGPGLRRQRHPELEAAPAAGLDHQDVTALRPGAGPGDGQTEAAAPGVS